MTGGVQVPEGRAGRDPSPDEGHAMAGGACPRRSRIPAVAVLVLACVALVAVFAPFLAPYPAADQHRAFVYAPPMRPHFVDGHGRVHVRPLVYPLVAADPLARTYAVDASRALPLRWGVIGIDDRRHLFGTGDEVDSPVFLLGTDGLGRDMFSRLALGARLSLGVAAFATLAALAIGVVIGAAAGWTGGALDGVAMRLAELVVVLPTIYVVLALRAVLPLALSPGHTFLLMVAILALVGWPHVARGVRSIVVAERAREYVAAAESLGASGARLLRVHLLPATWPFVMAQATLLVPAFILAETTLSMVGLGFGEPLPSWGAMLREALDTRVIADFPWMLSPAAAIFLVVLATNILGDRLGAARRRVF